MHFCEWLRQQLKQTPLVDEEGNINPAYLARSGGDKIKAVAVSNLDLQECEEIRSNKR